MTNIIDQINEWIALKFEGYDLKNFGFCEIMHKTANGSDQPIPVTIPNRLQVSLDDKFQILTWVRWIERTTYEDNDDWSFGTKRAKLATLPLRLIFAHKVELGENLVFDLIETFPEYLNVIGHQFVFVSGRPEIDPDHESIYNTELGKTVYDKHRFNWNVYAINLSVEFILCDSEDIRITENNEYRVTE